MKVELKFLLLLMVLILSACQSNLKSITHLSKLDQCGLIASQEVNEIKHTLVVISGLGCGHCEKAFRDLQPLADKCKIIVYEYGDHEKIKQKHQDKYLKYSFIPADNEACNIGSFNFFPMFFLFDKEQCVLKEKGYDNKLLKKLERQLIY